MRLKFQILFFLLTLAYSQDFLHVGDNGKIVDGNDEPILLRGFGLGGWLVQEGYMWGIGGFFASHTNIKNEILSLIGEEKTDEFYQIYHQNYITEQDIAFIAEQGFNTLRIPFHYKYFSNEPWVFINDGFVIIDRILEWCREYQIYLMLDMHCAPGAQSKDLPADSDGINAGLWTSALNRNWATDIWQHIANYYADEPWIAGYDLINEPVLSDGFTSIDLRNFYIQIKTAIRMVDQNHLLFIEGNWYGNDFTSLTPPFDNNMGYSFHHYIGPSHQTSWVNNYLSMSEQYNVPLWVGEFGENSNHWVHYKVNLFEQHDIGWSSWNYKHNGSITPVMRVEVPESFQLILNYWNNTIQTITAEEVETGLMDLAEAYRFENCTQNKGLLHAMTHPDFEIVSSPYEAITIPATLEAVHYDMGANGVAYLDYTYEDPAKFSGDSESWNNGWAYRNDGVDIQTAQDTEGSSHNVGWLENGEWMYYTVDVSVGGVYQVLCRAASQNNNGLLAISIPAQSQEIIMEIPNTGGYQAWAWTEPDTMEIGPGPALISMMVYSGGFNLKDIQITLISGNNTLPDNFEILSYPNPFNSTTTFLIPDGVKFQRIKIIDVNGAIIQDSGTGPALRNAFWNGRNESDIPAVSGVYFYEIEISNQMYNGKMTLIR